MKLGIRKAVAMAVGTIQIWGGKKYIKTSQGWITHSDEDKQFKKKAKLYHKEMRGKFGGSWVGEGEVKHKIRLVSLLIDQGKAEATRADGHIKVRFLKSDDELSKAKYTKRWKGKDGKWHYEYKDEKDFIIKKIDVKKVVSNNVREFKNNIVKFIPKNMTGEQKKKLDEMISNRGKILTNILSGVNSGKLMSFEGRGIISGLDEYYKLVGYNSKTEELEIKKKGSNKIYTKRVEDLLSEREKYNIMSKAISFNKSKYTKRWKGKDGKWHYEYAKPKSERKKKVVVTKKPEKGKEPWRIGPIKSTVFLNANKAEFNLKPGMVGDYLARKEIYITEKKLGKYMSNPKTKALIQASLRTEVDTWNYFAITMTQRDVSLIAHVAKRLGKEEPITSLNYVFERTGMLKTDLLKLLEYASFKKNRKEFIEDQMRAYMTYGATAIDAKEKSINYGERLKKKYHEHYIKIWGK